MLKVVLLCSSHTASVSRAFTSFWMVRAACRTPVDLTPATDGPAASRWARGRWGESLSCDHVSSPVKAQPPPVAPPLRCTCLQGYVGNGHICYGNIMQRLNDLNTQPGGLWSGQLSNAISLFSQILPFCPFCPFCPRCLTR